MVASVRPHAPPRHNHNHNQNHNSNTSNSNRSNKKQEARTKRGTQKGTATWYFSRPVAIMPRRNLTFHYTQRRARWGEVPKSALILLYGTKTALELFDERKLHYNTRSKLSWRGLRKFSICMLPGMPGERPVAQAAEQWPKAPRTAQPGTWMQRSCVSRGMNVRQLCLPAFEQKMTQTHKLIECIFSDSLIGREQTSK